MFLGAYLYNFYCTLTMWVFKAIFATGLLHKSLCDKVLIRATIAAGTDEIQVRISDEGLSSLYVMHVCVG